MSWIAKIGDLLQFLSGLTILLDLIGEERLDEMESWAKEHLTSERLFAFTSKYSAAIIVYLLLVLPVIGLGYLINYLVAVFMSGNPEAFIGEVISNSVFLGNSISKGYGWHYSKSVFIDPLWLDLALFEMYFAVVCGSSIGLLLFSRNISEKMSGFGFFIKNVKTKTQKIHKNLSILSFLNAFFFYILFYILFYFVGVDIFVGLIFFCICFRFDFDTSHQFSGQPYRSI